MLQEQLAGHPPSLIQRGSKQGTSFPASWNHKQLLSSKAWLRPQETPTLRSCFPYPAKGRMYAFRSSPPSSHPPVLSIFLAPLGKEACPSRPMWLEELLLYFCSQTSFKGKSNPPGTVVWSQSIARLPGAISGQVTPHPCNLSCRRAATRCSMELRHVKQCLVYLWVLREDVVDESFVARTQGTAAAAHTWKREDRASQQGQNPQLQGKALCGGAFGGKHILGFSGEAREDDRAPS